MLGLLSALLRLKAASKDCIRPHYLGWLDAVKLACTLWLTLVPTRHLKDVSCAMIGLELLTIHMLLMPTGPQYISEMLLHSTAYSTVAWCNSCGNAFPVLWWQAQICSCCLLLICGSAEGRFIPQYSSLSHDLWFKNCFEHVLVCSCISGLRLLPVPTRIENCSSIVEYISLHCSHRGNMPFERQFGTWPSNAELDSRETPSKLVAITWIRFLGVCLIFEVGTACEPLWAKARWHVCFQL